MTSGRVEVRTPAAVPPVSPRLARLLMRIATETVEPLAPKVAA